MSSEKLLIVFVKNIKLGKVKTRLAKTIGDDGAFEVYKELVSITEAETQRLAGVDIHIYFSDTIIDSKWPGIQKFVQVGQNLGARMQQAFQHGFESGYKRIIGVGSDLPDLNADIMNEGLDALIDTDTVFGPSEDGGYYLLGMNSLHNCIFENKSWSTESLISETTEELNNNNLSFKLLAELNDIDNIEDLKASSVSTKFKHLYELS
jgi:rSAM/selenodomain-associated transferase 1